MKKLVPQNSFCCQPHPRMVKFETFHFQKYSVIHEEWLEYSKGRFVVYSEGGWCTVKLVGVQ